MLSLKDTRIPHSKPTIKLLDLPKEIIDLILEYVSAAYGSKGSGVLSASITCRRLRLSAIPILFRYVTVLADSNGLKKRTQTALRHLSTAAHLLKHVRYLHILTPISDSNEWPTDAAAHYQESDRLLRKCTEMMTGLKQIRSFIHFVHMIFALRTDQSRLDHLSDLTIYLLRSMTAITDLHVTLDLQGMKYDLCGVFSISQCQSMSNAGRWSLDVSFPAVSHDYTRRSVLEIVFASYNVRALNCYQISHLTQYFAASGDILSKVEELYVSTMNVESLSLLKSSGNMPWANLRKLQLEGDRQIESLLPHAIERMQNLTHLRLRPCRTTVFHANCPASKQFPPNNNKLAFTRLPQLQHLELFSICNHLSMEQITTPTLKSLRIQLPEYAARLVGLESARSPADISWLAKNVPHLERLELHIGDLENLWHPTAIPGVDVDVEVYQFLQALSRLPKLKELRLFPHYVPRTTRHNFLNAKQPLSDEQAIRIFRHLRAQRPSLEMLSIAATFESLWTFSPMSWTVRNAGETAVLVTRQAGKDYEIEQIWVGERRLSMSNKRHTHRQPYLPDLGDWTYQLSKMPHRLHLPWTAEDEGDDDQNDQE